MRRSPFKKTTLGGGEARYTLRYESEMCEPGTREARMEQIRILRALADNPELHNTGLIPFQKLSMRHTGECWIIELEATGSE